MRCPIHKILVVDDEQSFLTLAKRIISKEGFEVLIAADGEEGLEMF
ncbi:MAG: hypothetical protein V3U37_05375 [Nitrospinaceae bacterium]